MDSVGLAQTESECMKTHPKTSVALKQKPIYLAVFCLIGGLSRYAENETNAL